VSSGVQRPPGRPAKPLNPNAGPTHRLAIKLRELRREAGLSQRALADRIAEQCQPERQFSRGVIQRLEAGKIDPIPPQYFRAHVVGCGGDLATWLTEYEVYRQEWRAHSRPTSTSDPLARRPSQARWKRSYRAIKIIWPITMLGLLLTTFMLVRSDPAGHPAWVELRSLGPLYDGVTDLDQVSRSPFLDNIQDDDMWIHTDDISRTVEIDAFNTAQLARWTDNEHPPSYDECRQRIGSGVKHLQIRVREEVCVQTTDGRIAWLHWNEGLDGLDAIVWEPTAH
jgi:transcriptional regulator with XRE-family HTH domain